ncbi:hypothetical protein NPIL_450121 [Nephila pilipes]|uniref:Uncharacterized protein n=1 Tax=Nephila pilipes TaxID=299642 RepID=A0A8X6UTS5_NEPPI|nr:hypothetical protein NPIL_450121 [Nephila pilipes]
MNFAVFVALQCLFVSGLVSAGDDELERPSNEEVKKILCEEENAETANFAVKCLNTMKFEDYDSLIKGCYKGMDGEITGESIQKWFCATPVNEIDEADECAAKELEAQDKGIEVYINFLLKLIACVEEEMSE